MKSLKRISETFLLKMIKTTYWDARRRDLSTNESKELKSDIAHYLEAKGLVKLTVYLNGGFNVHLTPAAFSYFQDKHDQLVHRFLFSLIIPLIVSLFGTLVGTWIIK